MENSDSAPAGSAASFDIKAWLSTTPVAITALLYAYVAMLGTIYNVIFYGKLSIHILNYYTIGDYLLGGLHNTIPMLSLFAGLFLALMLYLASSSVRMRMFRSWSFRLMVIVYPVMLVVFFPLRPIDQVKACRERVTVTLNADNASNGVDAFADQSLLGSTQSFLFLADPASATQVKVVPLDSVRYLTSLGWPPTSTPAKWWDCLM